MERVEQGPSAVNTKERCQFVCEPRCTRPVQFHLSIPDHHPLNVCMTHFRFIVQGQFGERANPPWTKEQALKALIEQDGIDPDTAQKSVDRHFGR